MNQSPFNWRESPSLLRGEFGAINIDADARRHGRAVKVVDVQGIVQMRREGGAWRDIALRFDCNKETAKNRCREVAPELLRPLRKGPKPANQIVILSRKETDRTNAIRGRG